VVRKLYPEVAFALDWLSNFGPTRMTGTGACVFASFADRAAADAVAQQIPAGYRGFVARSVDLSPVHAALGIAPSNN
jgi:4-diphosphocytidyl-2-C-methyl-D-erythritol kinase